MHASFLAAFTPTHTIKLVPHSKMDDVFQHPNIQIFQMKLRRPSRKGGAAGGADGGGEPEEEQAEEEESGQASTSEASQACEASGAEPGPGTVGACAQAGQDLAAETTAPQLQGDRTGTERTHQAGEVETR